MVRVTLLFFFEENNFIFVDLLVVSPMLRCLPSGLAFSWASDDSCSFVSHLQATRLLELAREQEEAGGWCSLDPAEARHACEEALLARYGQLPQHQKENVVRACVGRSRQFIL